MQFAILLLLLLQQPAEIPEPVKESAKSVLPVIATFEFKEGEDTVRRSFTGSAVSLGEGIFISAKHTFTMGKGDPQVLVEGFPASTIFLSSIHDASIIETNLHVAPIKINKSPIKLGQVVYGIGWRGGKQRMWKTIVFGKGFYPGDLVEDISHAQLGETGGAIGGNSGGALVNEEGELVGIVIACESKQLEPVDGSGTTVSLTPQAIQSVIKSGKTFLDKKQ